MLFAPRKTHRLFVPEGEAPARGWPVLLFLHGIGERGSDGIAPTTVGIGPAVQREPERFPMAIVFPQCPDEQYWSGHTLDIAFDALDAAIEELGADESRVYVSGISMGGYGTFAAALRDPRRFTAVVPVCGGVGHRDPRAAAERIAHLPLWIFHGDADTVVPVSESRTIVDALRDAGANVRYSEYAGVGHNSWDRAYAEPELVTWLLEQRTLLS